MNGTTINYGIQYFCTGNVYLLCQFYPFTCKDKFVISPVNFFFNNSKERLKNKVKATVFYLLSQTRAIPRRQTPITIPKATPIVTTRIKPETKTETRFRYKLLKSQNISLMQSFRSINFLSLFSVMSCFSSVWPFVNYKIRDHSNNLSSTTSVQCGMVWAQMWEDAITRYFGYLHLRH